MYKLADRPRDRKEEYTKLITLEMGKRLEETKAEIDFCADIVEFYTNGAENFLAEFTKAVESMRIGDPP